MAQGALRSLITGQPTGGGLIAQYMRRGQQRDEDALAKELAFARIRALEADTAFTELQRKEWEGNAFTRQLASTLGLQREHAGIRSENARTAASELERQLTQFNLDSAKEDRPNVRRRSKADADRAEADARTSRGQAFSSEVGAVGDLAGSLGLDPTPEDLALAVDTVTAGLGADEKLKPAFMQMLSGQVEQLKEKRRLSKEALDMSILKDRQESLGRAAMFGEVLGRAGVSDEHLSTMMSDSPFRDTIIGVARGVRDAKQVKTEYTPRERAFGEALGKADAERLSRLQDRLVGAQGELSEIQGGTYILGSKKDATSAKEAEIRQLEEEIVKLSGSAAGGSRSGFEGTAGSPQPDNAPVVSEKDYAKVPSGWYYRTRPNSPPRRKP